MPNYDPSDSISREKWIDRICDQFESAWRTSRPESIESIIESVLESSQTKSNTNDPDNSEQKRLLATELIAVEIELRRVQGQDPTFDEYLSRFPYIDPCKIGCLLERSKPVSDPPLFPETVSLNFSDSAARAPDEIHATEDRIFEYELLQEIARGGMGVVYKGRDKDLKRDVAVILCEILTGRPPCVAESLDQLRRKVVRADLSDAYERLEHSGADGQPIIGKPTVLVHL